MRAFRLAYDGAPFHGFQRQPDVPTVEDALFDALRALGICEGDPQGYSAAGRTDAGVSAAAQTVTFDCPDWCDPAALDSELPESIRAWASADVSDFHATHDAREREYVYFLAAPGGAGGEDSAGGAAGTGIHDPAGGAAGVDDARAREAAARLSGEHDFHNLTPDETGTVRDVSIDLERDGEFLVVSVRAGGFPRQLVRRLVSLLRAVATGAAPPSKVDRVLGAEPIDGPEGVPPAPAHPLVLADVAYDVDFAVDPAAAGAARNAFATRRREHAARSRVAGAIANAVSPGPGRD